MMCPWYQLFTFTPLGHTCRYSTEPGLNAESTLQKELTGQSTWLSHAPFKPHLWYGSLIPAT